MPSPIYKPPTGAFTEPPAPALPPPPESVSASASSKGGGGFGYTPDFSSMTPEQLAAFQEGLSNLTYSLPLGGYLYSSEANNPNSAYVKGYYGQPMTGGQGGANLAAGKLWGQVGELPTVAKGSPALTQFQKGRGISPTQGPSYNERLREFGLGPYKGPWEYPGYSLNPFKS